MTYVLLFFLSSWFYFISHVPKDISPRDRTVETDEPKINVYIYIIHVLYRLCSIQYMCKVHANFVTTEK